MLVLSRKSRQSVMVGGGGGFDQMLKVTVLEIAGGHVKLGFEADSAVPVHRLELWERMCAEREIEGRGTSPAGPRVTPG